MSNKKTMTMIIDRENKTIRPEDWDYFCHVLDFFPDKSRVTITVESYVRTRSVSQNGLFYKYIQIVAEESGQGKEDLKNYLKKQYGPRMEDGSLKSTADYSTTEMNFMIDRLIQEAAEMSIMLPNPEDMRNYNIKVDGN